jgi:hypothetical protein
LATAWIRSFVSVLISELSLNARETVDFETQQIRAISAMV